MFRGRRKGNFKTRATIGGVMIALTALWALTVSYDITWQELFAYLAGSVVVLLLAMLSAVALLLALKLVRAALRWLARRLGGS